jgi:hypothetical protein
MRILRHAEQRDLTFAVLDSFVSRNNDLDGFWAIGLLCAAADAAGVQTLTLDLLAGTCAPDCAVGARVARAYGEFLRRQLEKRELEPDSVARLHVWLRFHAVDTLLRGGPDARYGEPFECMIALELHDGYVVDGSRLGRCRPHDPQRESRRG